MIAYDDEITIIYSTTTLTCLYHDDHDDHDHDHNDKATSVDIHR